MMDTVRVLDIVLIMIDRRNVVNFSIHHFRDGLIVHVRRVFERIGARANGIACSHGAVEASDGPWTEAPAPKPANQFVSVIAAVG
jgi:hypothetical protein